MFIPLFLSTLHLSSSVPTVSPVDYSSPSLLGRDPPEFANAARYRTLQVIIWSCLATMFACTWVAVHPNIPGPNESVGTRLRRRAITMAYALLAPELMTLWALRQRIAAQEIAKKFNGMKKEKRVEPWTLTHGFFIQMGGFVLCRDRAPIRALTFQDLATMIRSGKVDPPNLSEDEIDDKSKGDFLTKLFVVLQTTWFVVQCLVRWASDLPVTELEVVTLAFAVLNVITYALWWKKPQNVLIPVRVELKECAEGTEIGPLAEKEKWIVRKLKKEIASGWFGRFVGIPRRIGQALMRPLLKMAADDNQNIDRGSLRFPIFYADGWSKEAIALSVGITVIFGSLHLIPWSSSFPTNIERWIWRSSALFAVIQPLLFLTVFLEISSDTFQFLIAATTGFYVMARLALLALAFITLRRLPPGAYHSIEWTTFLPHI